MFHKKEAQIELEVRKFHADFILNALMTSLGDLKPRFLVSSDISRDSQDFYSYLGLPLYVPQRKDEYLDSNLSRVARGTK